MDIKAAVCIVADEKSFYMARYAIENMLAKTEIGLSLYLFNISPPEAEAGRLHQYFTDLCTPESSHYSYVSYGSTVADCRNAFLKLPHSTVQYLCFFPISHLVGNRWMEDLIYAADHFTDAGILSIRTGSENCQLAPQLTEDLKSPEPVFKHTWAGEFNFVKGILFLLTENKDKIGNFLFHVEQSIAGFEDYEACFHAQAHGLKNFYIVGASAFHYKMINDELFGSVTNESAKVFKGYIEKQVKQYNNGESKPNYAIY